MWKSHYYAEFVLWLDLDGTICHLQTAGHFGKAELQRNIDCKSMLQFEGGGKKKKKKKKKSELSLKKKNLEEERVDTQKMEKKNAKISLSLPLCLSVSLTHTTHMQSFFCAGKGEKYKKFQGHRKTTRTKTKKNLGICTLDNLADKLFCLVLEETKKEGTYLGWDFIACTKQNFFCNNSFIQPKTKKQGFEEEKYLLTGFKTRDKHQSLFPFSRQERNRGSMCKNNNRRSCPPRDLLLLLLFGYGLLQRRRRRKKKSSTQIRNKTQNPPGTQPPTPPTPLRKLVKVGIIVVVVVLTSSEPPSVCQTDTAGMASHNLAKDDDM
jgi:hypothetical protein